MFTFYLQVPEIEDYWKTSWNSSIPFFGNLMPRDRFLEIFWLLHISHPDPSHPEKMIDKICALLELLLAKFQHYFYPSQKLSVDETMVGFRGRFGSTQYTPKKPVKWGIKSFTLADAETGYMLNIVVYTGAQTLDDADAQFASLPVLARTVLHLVNPYLGMGHHIFADRLYSSIPLVQTLADNQTHFTGTINKNRIDLPDAIRAPFTLTDDGTMQFRSEKVMVIAWRAKSKKTPLIMISSFYSAGITQAQTRKAQEVPKPIAVEEYNKYMNGVDRNDQHCTYYSFIRKTLKWWRKMFFYLLECSTVNSYILYKKACTEAEARPLTSIDFRRSIIDDLVREHLESSNRQTVGRPRLRPTPIRLNKKLHLLNQRSTNRNCVVCSGERRHTTLYYCTTCPEEPALHPTTCFERYHTLEHYQL